jgi:hypothetical protein
MAIDLKPGQTVRVTISKNINRAAARKTIERLFCKDKTLTAPLKARSRNFITLPKRRGGQIWTKRPNKIHLALAKGDAATLTATPQAIKDLASVGDFVDVQAK